MRVFVVGTGRCGTCTFYQACRHIDNYTVNHEGNARRVLFGERINYEDQHIEIASHLFMEMGYLIRKYPEPSTCWVHLIREPQSCIQSLSREKEAMRCFARQWLGSHMNIERDEDFLEIARTFYHYVNEGIANQLANVRTLRIHLEDIEHKWGFFWNWIGATGDFDKSKRELQRHYNPTGNRGRDEYK